MVCRMKTTVELSDPLVAKAKAYAARNGVTLRSLIEIGLRLVMRAGRTQEPFRLRDRSVGGKGLQPQYRDADWSRIREAIYKGRGG